MATDKRLEVIKDRNKVCVYCGHHKFWKKNKGQFCTKCGRRRKYDES